mmetsp:Transcript_6144/g.10983  ORF Transcript_6144/g.10983 Transcript_6144/m.10983 type:complete len:124 (+) Transcript_6144:165-536(+)|eukprot:CAMPEP_0201884488 /NCGR_PEP_ID=MMETSP0902-20130614/17297_1 /ASSEMBLY_ACC=CAM_ASM_000551 /TAXON_ID=420261 /ORGANISM="Thalassiosira antarctica, Strain CCMP982" /LENGTH=123 /DNA_ID=CAMNT_0048413467 /DNA_START=126 /DNA_END=497 /DNA_ORIENTATION=+
MARFGTILVALLTAASGATAFSPHPSIFRHTHFHATANEDTDFDAPVPKYPQNGAAVLDHEIVVIDDECYLGKYGQYAECVDFDPIHMDANTQAKHEMPNFSSLGEEIAAAFKNSPLGKLFDK